jgi:hypothetical protein
MEETRRIPRKGAIFALAISAFIGLAYAYCQFQMTPEEIPTTFTWEGNNRATVSGELIENSTFPEIFPLKIKSVTLHRDIFSGVSRVCVTNIRATTGSVYPAPGGPYITGQYFLSLHPGIKEPICTSNQDIQLLNVGWDINIPIGDTLMRRYYRYPFDDMTIGTRFIVDLTMYNNDDAVIREEAVEKPNQSMYVSIRGRDVSRLHHELGMDLKLVRPDSLKNATIIVTILIVLSIASMFLVTEFNTVIEVAVALVLGIAGLRIVLVQGNTPGFIAIDQLFLAAYVAIAIVVGAHPLVHGGRARWRGKSQEPREPPPQAAKGILTRQAGKPRGGKNK